MEIRCCARELLPTAHVNPKYADYGRDYGCPSCGRQYSVMVSSWETHQRRLDAINAERAAAGARPLTVKISETRE